MKSFEMLIRFICLINIAEIISLRVATPMMRMNEPISKYIQGNSIRTWSYRSPVVEQVEINLTTEGRPLDADIELWNGPSNSPCKMRVYGENGYMRPFSTVIEMPGGPNTVGIRNIGDIELPMKAYVTAQNIISPSRCCFENFNTIQGGAIRSYPFAPNIDSVEIYLKTNGLPLNARIELLQGPNNNKQVIELYTDDGCDRPFFSVLKTPGPGNIIRVLNTAPIEFPMIASVVPYTINNTGYNGVVIGGLD
tara:strand:- start:1894 stop:2646 length:753 start_codon:yes stop_codon:yes gene_type:complete